MANVTNTFLLINIYIYKIKISRHWRIIQIKKTYATSNEDTISSNLVPVTHEIVEMK